MSDYYGLISIDTAVVNDAGDLLIGLTNGNVINAGHVRGRPGLPGERGLMGPAGDPGRKGLDGAQLYTGLDRPSDELGKEGDLYIDIRSSHLDIYQKTNGKWIVVSTLRDPSAKASSAFVSGGSGSGGTGGIAQTTSTLPLSGTGRASIDAPGGTIIEEKKNCRNQANLNNWIQAGLVALDEELPVSIVTSLPASGEYEGDLAWHNGGLHIWVDGTWEEVGTSRPTKEALPWVEISYLSISENNTAWGQGYAYSTFWQANPSASTTWQWEWDIDGNGDWIDIAFHPRKDDLGFVADSESASSVVLTKGNQTVDFPNAKMRFRVTGSLNGFDSEVTSDEVPAWTTRTDLYDPPYYDDGLGNQDEPDPYDDQWIKEQFAIRSLQTQFFDTAIRDNTVEIVKTKAAIAAVNADLSAEVIARKAGDSDLQAQIDAIEVGDPFDPTQLQEDLEAEKTFRIAGDATNAAAILEEARIREDEDFKLLARINGIEIPDIPGDFDDSDLRELIAQEGALRASGDAALNVKIEDNTSLINDTNDALSAERATRAEQIAAVNADITNEAQLRQVADSDLQAQIDAIPAGIDLDTYTADQQRQDDALSAERATRIENIGTLNADLQQEASARRRGDSDLQAQIDLLEVPENLEETIERLDNDIKVTNEKIDWNAQETLTDQERQDAITDDHELRLVDLEAIEPVEYLNDLQDVDLTGTRAAAIENEFHYIHYRLRDPGRGEISNNGTAIIIHKEEWEGNSAAPLFDRIVAGSIMNFNGIAAGVPVSNEQGIVETISPRGDTYEISFKSPLPFLVRLAAAGIDQDAVSIIIGYAGHDPDGPTPPDAPGDTVTAGTFLGYDKDKALWVPQTLDVSGGGVTDLSDYYTKQQVDDKIDAIEVDADLDDYYTKAEVDASQSTQDSRLDALEAGGGSGPDPQTGLNTLAIASNKNDIEELKAGQDTQDNAIDNLESAVLNRYTKDEVDDKFDALEDPDLSNYLVKDAPNDVTADWRVVTGGSTFLSTAGGELGLYNVRTPSNRAHATNQGYVDDQDAATLQSAKDYADSLEADLSEYYTKTEVDDSQAAQDAVQADLSAALGALGTKVDDNTQAIDAIDASNVEQLNDLTDVSMSVTTLSISEAGVYAQEDRLYSTQYKGWYANSGRISDGNWSLENGTLYLSKTAFFGDEVDDLIANMIVGNKVYLSANHNNLTITKQPDRATITAVGDVGNAYTFTFDDPLTELATYMSRTWDTDTEATIQVAISEVINVPEVPDAPEVPTRRSDIVLGYDSSTNLWKPYLSDYLPLTGGTLTGDLKFDGDSIRATNGKKLRIYGQDPSGNNRTFIDLQNANHAGVDGAEDGYRLKLYHLAEPEAPLQAANKQYVDRLIHRPPGLRFKYKSGSPLNSTVADGEFKFVKNDGKMRVSNKSLDVDFSQNTLVQDININDHSYNFTIWKVLDDGKWQVMVQGYSSRADWHATDVYFYTGVAYEANNLVDGEEYYITVGGIF